jgi:mannose-6-phosphate isomerase
MGRTLDELVRQDPVALLGFEGDSFPLLAKWLDCHQWLSVQVHPDDRLAAQSGHRGKTECWFVRSVSGEARLIHGLLPGTRPEQLYPDARLLDFVDYREAREGDVFLTPAGTVHALGPGLFLYEIQQSSDLTYRMYDWDRPGLDGRPRAMHFEEAMTVLREVPPYLAPPVPDGTVGVVRVNTPFFVVEELLQGLHSWTPARAEIVTAFRGTGVVNGIPLADGQALVLPASVGPVTVDASGMLLRTWIPT